jgi:limonene-1,2-epoxide hydrolase
MATIQQVAEAFSTHRFREVYDFFHPDIQWVLVGVARLEGRDQVVSACEGSLKELARTTTQFLRFKTAAGPEVVAIDAIARYVDAKWKSTFVSSCDIFEFTEGSLTKVTSYTVEVDSSAVK